MEGGPLRIGAVSEHKPAGMSARRVIRTLNGEVSEYLNCITSYLLRYEFQVLVSAMELITKYETKEHLDRSGINSRERITEYQYRSASQHTLTIKWIIHW